MTSKFYNGIVSLALGAALTTSGCAGLILTPPPRVDKCSDYRVREDLATVVSRTKTPAAFKELADTVLRKTSSGNAQHMNRDYKARIWQLSQFLLVVPEDGCNQRSYGVAFFKDVNGNKKFDPGIDDVYWQCGGPRKEDRALASALDVSSIPQEILLQIGKKELEQSQKK